ncbi:Ribose 1,5-bisphosphate phosphokinase PhnN [Pseudomonas fluorescens]|nr:Ribose 1,5-bisphosphate phosphokinase PhnN [Pseudomonas fluorescens]
MLCEDTLGVYRDPLENPLVQPVSVMDHTPGLRADLAQAQSGRSAVDPANRATNEEGGLMAGRLIYLIGPSGSGKDSLLDAARTRLAESGCRIVRRVITRSAEAVGEAALGVSEQQFAEMEAQGAFALSWHANGLSYGIPREIDNWLAAGQDVLINGSRGHLQNTRLRYPNALVLLLTVDQAVLRQRLLERGRESPIEIDQRLARNARFSEQLLAEDPAVHVLDNSGPLEQTVERLLVCIDE